MPLWPSVRREFLTVLALLPVLRSSMRMQWDNEVVAYDACPHGFGSVVVFVGLSLLEVPLGIASTTRWRSCGTTT